MDELDELVFSTKNWRNVDKYEGKMPTVKDAVFYTFTKGVLLNGIIEQNSIL